MPALNIEVRIAMAQITSTPDPRNRYPRLYPFSSSVATVGHGELP
jgi:hypothetical protein